MGLQAGMIRRVVRRSNGDRVRRICMSLLARKATYQISDVDTAKTWHIQDY